MATISRLMTEEEFLALPEDDGVERELIRGELRETADDDPELRPCTSSSVIMRLAIGPVEVWLDDQPEPAGLRRRGRGPGPTPRRPPDLRRGRRRLHRGRVQAGTDPRKARICGRAAGPGRRGPVAARQARGHRRQGRRVSRCRRPARLDRRAVVLDRHRLSARRASRSSSTPTRRSRPSRTCPASGSRSPSSSRISTT